MTSRLTSMLRPNSTAAFSWHPPASLFGGPIAPELEFILGCASPAFDDASHTRAEEFLRADLNWENLAELAMRHGLSPLLYSRIHASLPNPLPSSLLKLKSDAIALTQCALIHTTEITRLIPRLEQSGIETLVFKGPTLAHLLYGSVARRPFLDLDIMVHAADVLKAWSLLESEGYQPAYKISPQQLPALIASANHLPLYGSPNNQLVELHWAFFAKSRATPFDSAGAWARREPLRFDDLTLMTLAPRDLVHFLCLHGTKHAWCRLSWLTDLAWFAFRYPTFDWNALLDHAARLGTRRMTCVGLALAHQVFRIPLPEPITRQFEDDSEVLPLARWMWQRLLDGDQSLPTGLELVQLTLRSRERRRDRARDFYYQLITPRPNELAAAHPSARFPTYTWHRLGYLLLKYSRVSPSRSQDRAGLGETLRNFIKLEY